MILVAGKIYIIGTYHVCKHFSNGMKVMLLVLYHVHKDVSNGAKFRFYGMIHHAHLNL